MTIAISLHSAAHQGAVLEATNNYEGEILGEYESPWASRVFGVGPRFLVMAGMEAASKSNQLWGQTWVPAVPVVSAHLL